MGSSRLAGKLYHLLIANASQLHLDFANDYHLQRLDARMRFRRVTKFFASCAPFPCPRSSRFQVSGRAPLTRHRPRPIILENNVQAGWCTG
jgi:hypothetical protein